MLSCTIRSFGSRPSVLTRANCRTSAHARLLSTSSPSEREEDNEREPKKETTGFFQSEDVNNLLDSSSRGVGQVIFLNSPVMGKGILLSLALGDVRLASMAALGTVTATSAAAYAGLDKSAIDNGLMGYNGCLVGCAASVFGPSSVLAASTFTLLGAAATPFCATALTPVMGSVPQWTLAFNFVTLTALFRTQPLLADSAAATASPSFLDVGLSPLTGIGQIFVVESALTGALVAGCIADYSPRLAMHAVMGSTVGTLVGVMCGADTSEIAMGLWGFNSCLTSMGTAVFFCHSPASMALSAGGAAATAALFGALKTVCGAVGAPCLTMPFCITMSGCYLLGGRIPGLVLAKEPHSPEKNAS